MPFHHMGARLIYLVLAILITTTSAYKPYPSIPTTGGIFGEPPYLTISYYYPLLPPASHIDAYRFGVWPETLPVRPSSIYECMPPLDRGFEPRTYTCKNHEIPDDEKTPEQIRVHEEARARTFDGAARGICDANTGLAAEVLHWGIWQHNCWSASAVLAEHGLSPPPNSTNTSTPSTLPKSLNPIFRAHIDWNLSSLYWRRHVLLQLAAHHYALNVKIRARWATKNTSLEQVNKMVNSWRFGDKQRWREMNRIEAVFWQDTFALREVGRELEKLVPIYFERRMKGEKTGFNWFGLGDVEIQA